MNKEHFHNTISPIKDKLYRFALRLVGSSPEAEDVVQEVMIKLWKQQGEWSQLKSIEAWSMRLTKNLSIDKIRSKHRQTEDISTQFDLVSPQANPYQQTESSDTMQQIRQMMQQLPEQQRMCMHLRDIEGMSYQEVADTLEISLNQVKVNINRARGKMRLWLTQVESR